MRGKDRRPQAVESQLGITPAHAGKRIWQRLMFVSVRDHPRACGEKTAAHRRWNLSSGSPPRMRGKGGDQRRPSSPRGITPAHAGKRITGKSISALTRDHPRACGEKIYQRIIGNIHLGSPPRMRGKGC